MPRSSRGKDEVSTLGDVTLSQRALIVWHERPDLQSTFDIETGAGRIGLFWWILIHGFREYGWRYDEELDGPAKAVLQPATGIPQRDFTPITWLLLELWGRNHLSGDSLNDANVQRKLLAHYFARDLIANNLNGFLTEHEAFALLAPDAQHPGIPTIQALIWESDPAFGQRYSSPEDAEFSQWCITQGNRDYPILNHPLIALARPAPRMARPLKQGINLIGHVRSRLGIGEDVRMAAQAAAAAGINFTIHNVAAGPSVKEDDASFDHLLSDELPYSINLFCMSGMSTIRATRALAQNCKLTPEHRNIGFWPWELPEWPRFWNHAYDTIDEVWASSHYTYDAYCLSSPVPVRHAPMAVAVTEGNGLGRADFNLPENTFLFAFSFDANSTYARKNPGATIDAFHNAFGRSDGSVGLVMKSLRVDQGSPAWLEIMARIDGDPRIHVVTESLQRGALLDLYRCADCLISLHRSEGFGRNIVEFMMLGKPVIVTAHSGNMDYTNHETASLISARLRPVAPGEYAFGEGQLWAEPDIDSAAAAMKRMIADAPWRESIAKSGQRAVLDRYHPAIVGRTWAEALGFSASVGAAELDLL